MNQLQHYSAGSLRSLNFFCLSLFDNFKNVFNYKKASNAPLLALSNQLYDWNTSILSKVNSQSSLHNLTLEDVSLLKQKISLAMQNSSAKPSEVIADQLFFLAIGAIQVQFQTGSDQAWQLIDHSVNDFLNAQKEKRIYSLGLFSTAVAICLSILMLAPVQLNNISAPAPIKVPVKQTPVGSTDPVTISMLQLAYKKMQNGTCQLPQAGMLPPEQRHAFLSFVNNGVIEVEHVENLRLALGYVDCLYPQKLMGSSITLANLK